MHTEEPFACYRSRQCASGRLKKTQGGRTRLVAPTPWCEFCHEVRLLRARAGLCLSRPEKGGAIDQLRKGMSANKDPAAWCFDFFKPVTL